MADAPSHASLLHDDTKTLITLGTALLGVTATFGKDLLSPGRSPSSVLIVAWIFLALSIVASMWGSATVFSQVKGGRSAGGSASFAINVSFFALVIGLVLLAQVAYSNWDRSGRATVKDAVETAQQAVADAGQGRVSELQVKSYKAETAVQVKVIVTNATTSKSFVVVVDRDRREPVELTPQP
jgi:hypothetical protein